MTKNLLIIILLILLTSCVKKTYFTENDLEWFNVYEVNDTLIFQETNSLLIDTTIIVQKIIKHTGYNPISSEKDNHMARLSYQNNKYKHLNELGAEMLEMYKYDNNVDAKPWLSYLGFSYDLSNYDFEFENSTLHLTNKYFDKVYILNKVKNKHHRKTQDMNPKTLYWDKTNGIIKYETYEGAIWERINW